MATSDTLRAVIDAGSSNKRLDELSSARVIGKIALQLHAAQQKVGAGKAVGPVSPGHIRLLPTGEARLELSETSALGYSSPEQIGGGAGDRRSDVFSLGAVLWEALTYQRLFDAMNDTAVRIAVTEREIQAPAEINANIPAELSAICMRALSRNPTDRYQSLKAMAIELEEFLSEAGYDDNDAKIAAHLAALEPRPRKSVTIELLPYAQPARPSEPPASLAQVAAPSMLATPPTVAAEPAEPAAPGLALAAKLARAGSTTSPPPMAAATVPAPPILPSGSSPMRTDRGTIAVAVPPPVNAIEASYAEAKRVNNVAAAPAPTMVDATPPMVEPTPPMVDPTPPMVDAPPPTVATAPTMVDAPPPTVETAPLIVEAAKPTAINGREATPLPKRRPSVRDSKDVLAGWGWSTDPSAAPPDNYVEEEDYEPPHDSRKTLLYVIGGGLVVAAVVTIITVGFGGSKPKLPTLQHGSASSVAPPPPEPAPPTPSVDTHPPGDQAAPIDPANTPTTEPPAAEPAKLDTPATAPAPAATTPTAATAAPAKVDTPATAPAPATVKTPPAKTPPAKTPPAKLESAKTEPAKTEPAKTEPAKTEPIRPHAKIVKATRAEPKIAKTEPAKTEPAKTEAKSDVETAYRTGLQQFARGDTTGALASLRTSLAGNPNYAPTWRGLGLVFEKMGEKDQARAAFKRYLQLAPTAGDAEQIRSRLEKLGT